MSIDAPPRGPTVEELERLVRFEDDTPKYCHCLDPDRPGYRLCGTKAKGKGGSHDGPSLRELLETGMCTCGRKYCPDCLRVMVLRHAIWTPTSTTLPRKKRWWWR